MSRVRLPVALLGCLLATAGAAPAPSPPTVTVYRCTDANGRLSLRDSPCRTGEHQQVRSMLRPTDAPIARSRPVEGRGPRRDNPPARVVYLAPSRPTYECTTPDGERYTSDTPEGNPRWVPLWTLGYPGTSLGSGIDSGYSGGYGGGIDYRNGGTHVRIGGGERWRGAPVITGPAAYGGGTWIRDACNALPPEEACARLQDRRDELDHRYTSALQGDRDAIVREERGIDARLASECAR